MNWKSRVRSAFASSEHLPDDDVIDELAQHARAMYDAARADGCSHDEADHRVADQLGRWRTDAVALQRKSSRTLVVEPPPAVSSSRFSGLAQDIRYGARLLRRQPRYALIVSLTMALGIGATTTLFSVTNGVLMKGLPWPDADRLVLLKETRGGIPPRFGAFSNTAYVAWRQQATTIEDIAGWSQRTVTLGGAGDPERIRIAESSASLFSVLGAHPLIGSLFQEKDEVAQDGAVIVLAESLWRQHFGGDTAVLGRLVQLDGQPHSVIGVLPDRLAYPDRQIQAWVPFRIAPSSGNSLSMFSAIARLRPGASAAQAASEGTARGRFVADTGMTTMAIFGSNGPMEITSVPLHEALTGDVSRPLVVLLIAVALLLVTATANVASLQLARATTRRREMAIRAALGAGSVRVARQLLVESLLLGFTGGGSGLVLAWLLHRLIPSLLPADFPRLQAVHLDTGVILFAVVASVLTSIGFGLLPALRARRLNLVESLSEDGMAALAGVGPSRTAQVRMIIMAIQVAIACVLLVGASLLGRSFIGMLNADRGFDPAGVLTVRLALPSPVYTPERRYAVLSQILGRLASVPGVGDAAFTSEMPLTPGGSTSAFTFRSANGEGTVSVQASPRVVSPDYFPALGMRIIAGRGFAESDTEGSTPVVVVNQRLARRYLGDAPLDAKLPMGVGYLQGDIQATVIGVVDDVRYVTAHDATQPELYYSFRQLGGRVPVPAVTLLVRAHTDPNALGPALRMVVREADANLVAEAVVTLEDRVLTGLARPRLYAILLGAFAAFALVVAAVGLFGVLSYAVAQRTRELGLRAALGARPLDIVRLVLRQGLAMTGAGLAAGLLLSMALTRSIATLLYGITPYDRTTYLGVPIILLIVAAAACAAPACRAARLDPLRALRQ
jgi:putative ABC transport system permease protein